MAVVVGYRPKGLTRETYDEVSQKMEAEWPPDGLDTHILFGEEGSLLVSEIWDSKEQYEAFAEKIRPVFEEAGLEMTAPPEVLQVHELQKREGAVS